LYIEYIDTRIVFQHHMITFLQHF